MKKLSRRCRLVNRILFGTVFLVVGMLIYLKSVSSVEPMILEEAIVYSLSEPIKAFFSFFGSVFGILVAASGLYIYCLPLVRKNII